MSRKHAPPRHLKHQQSPAQQQDKPIDVRYGHDGRRVLVQFSQPVTLFAQTPEECRQMLKFLQATLDTLEGRTPAVEPAANG